MADVKNFPVKGWQRWKNRLGQFAVPCIVSDRWLKFAERSELVGGEHVVWVDVMTMPDGENARKLCSLAIAKEDLMRVVSFID